MQPIDLVPTALGLLALALLVAAWTRDRGGLTRDGYDLRMVAGGGLIERIDRDPAGPRTLIVGIHGWRGDNKQWLPLLRAAGLDSDFRGCDFYLFSYARGLRSQTSLERYGAAVISEVDILDRTRDYDRVILLGYSVGGLIARSAFVRAIADRQDIRWVDKVWRIVLLATPNRGLSGDGRPIGLRLGLAMVRFFGGIQVQDAFRGSDFITRLRLDWVSLFGDSSIKTPPVIQLLGLNDDYVLPADSRDVTAFDDSKLFTVQGNHRTVVDFGQANDLKYERLKLSLFGEIRAELDQTPVGPPPPSAVVFQLHGIRDFGSWLTRFEHAVKRRDPNARVVRPGYGYFTALGFAIPWIRSRRIAWFCDQYTEEVAMLATQDVPFYFIGHSYGTYLLAHGLEKFPKMRFRRACLVGSVMPYEWDWRTPMLKRKQLEGLRNDCGSHDWPVAVLCKVLRDLFRFKDIGVGGFRGFADAVPEQMIEHRYVRGNHSAGLGDDQRLDGMVQYLLTGKGSPVELVGAAPWLDFASRWAVPLVVASLATIAAAIYFASVTLGLSPLIAVPAALMIVVILLNFA
jgi:pimeloyl-ACP methyl ester carboxylesterase